MFGRLLRVQSRGASAARTTCVRRIVARGRPTRAGSLCCRRVQSEGAATAPTAPRSASAAGVGEERRPGQSRVGRWCLGAAQRVAEFWGTSSARAWHSGLRRRPPQNRHALARATRKARGCALMGPPQSSPHPPSEVMCEDRNCDGSEERAAPVPALLVSTCFHLRRRSV